MPDNKYNVELMNLYWTTAGIFPGEGEISPFDFRDRVEAASRAGFKGIGIWHADLTHTLKKWTMAEIKMMLADNGLKHLELEFLTDWFLQDGRKKESDKIKHKLFKASEALGARHIKVGDFNNTPCPMSRIIESFAILCSEAKNYGARIAFEFMPSAMIDNLNDAITLVENAATDNGGLALDIAHLINKGNVCRDLRRVRRQYLISFELNDGLLPANPLYNRSPDRKFCGEGEFDIKGFVRCAKEIGYTGPWAVEVFSKELSGLSPDEINKRAFKSAMAQFDDF